MRLKMMKKKNEKIKIQNIFKLIVYILLIVNTTFKVNLVLYILFIYFNILLKLYLIIAILK